MQQKLFKHRFIFGIFWAFLGQALTVVFGIVSTALLARLISTSELGVFFLASSFVIIFAAFFQLGVGKAATRLIAGALANEDADAAWSLTQTIFCVILISVALGYSLFYLLGFDYLALNILNSDLLASLKWLVLLWGCMFALRTVILDIFRGFHDIRSTILLGEPFAKLILSLVLAILWVLEFEANINIAIFIVLISVLSSVILSTIVLYRRGRKYLPTSLSPVRPIIAISLPLLVTNLANMAYGQASIWIVGSTQPEEEVALFGAALRLAILVSTPLLVISAVIPPMIAELYTKHSMRRMESLLRASATISAVPAALLLILFVFFGDKILGSIYGTHYEQAHLLLVILGTAQFVYVFTGPSGLSLAMTEHQKSLMVLTGISLALLVGSGIYAGYNFGTVGVAVASGCVMSAHTAATLFIAKKKIGVWAYASTHYLRISEIIATCGLLLERFRKK